MVVHPIKFCCFPGLDNAADSEQLAPPSATPSEPEAEKVILLRGAEDIVRQIQSGSDRLEDLLNQFCSIVSRIIPSVVPEQLKSTIFYLGLNRGLPFCYQLNDRLQIGIPLQEIENEILVFFLQKERIVRCVYLYEQILWMMRFHRGLMPREIEGMDKKLQDFFSMFSTVCPDYPIMKMIETRLFVGEQMELAKKIRLQIFIWTNDQFVEYFKQFFDREPVLHEMHIEPPPEDKPGAILEFIKEISKTEEPTPPRVS